MLANASTQLPHERKIKLRRKLHDSYTSHVHSFEFRARACERGRSNSFGSIEGERERERATYSRVIESLPQARIAQTQNIRVEGSIRNFKLVCIR